VAGLAELVYVVTTDTDGDGKINDELRARIENNTDDIGVTSISHGRIDAFRAVVNSSSPPSTNLPPAPNPVSNNKIWVVLINHGVSPLF
jgi:hypothetical protein